MPQDKIKVGVTGYKGRIGGLLAAELKSNAWPTLSLSAVSERDAGDAPSDFIVVTDPHELARQCDVVVDFTRPEASLETLDACRKRKIPIVIGTTGFTADQDDLIRAASADIAVVHSANMSLGVNILLAMVEHAAARLGPEWDIEIVESHHRNKIDSPSGTALALGTAARTGRGQGDFVFDRTGKRRDGDIGFATVRGGDVVGEHSVIFHGMGERVEFGHNASDRALFVRGALTAAQWVASQKPGLYTMRDVLGL